MCLLVFWSKSEDAFGPGKWKKTFWALKSLLFHSITLTFRAKQRQLIEAQKVFSFLTTSNLNRNHPRLPRQFLNFTLQQVEAQVSMCLLGKHQPCRARAHETKREPGAYSWPWLRTHRSTDHTHFWSKREDAFGPGKWKKTFWALKSLLFHSITLTFRAKQRQLIEAQKVFSFLTTSNLNRNHPRLPRQFLNSWNEIKIVLVNSP